MRWSIQELFRSMSYHYQFRWWRKILFFPVTFYSRMKVFFFWLFTGYTKESLWGIDDLILKELEFRLRKYIEKGFDSYPFNYESVEEWETSLRENLDKLNKLNTEYYSSLYPKWGVVGELDDDAKEEIRKLMKNQEKNDEEVLEWLSENIRSLWY